MLDHLLLTEEEQLLRTTVRDFADNTLAPRAAAYDQSGDFPADNIEGLAELGLFGLGIDEAYGGSGGTARQGAIVAEELARGCTATSTVYVAHQSLAAQFIHMHGTAEHKQSYLPSMTAGRTIGAFALTEPGAGSDAAGIRTTAKRDGDDYVLNGSKVFITNATEAGVLIVLASLDLSLGSRGFVALIVDGDTPGMTINPMHGKMGIRASSTCEVFFDDCRVPVTNRMSEEYEGFRATMEVLNASRIGIAAQAVGVAQAAFEQAVEYAKQRKAFGKTISEMQGIQWMIADMATEVEAAQSARDAGGDAPRRGEAVRQGGLNGEAVRVSRRGRDGGQGRADTRRSRVLFPVDGGAPVPRRQDNRDLRGHVRDPAHDNLAERS